MTTTQSTGSVQVRIVNGREYRVTVIPFDPNAQAKPMREGWLPSAQKRALSAIRREESAPSERSGAGDWDLRRKVGWPSATAWPSVTH